MRYAQVALNVPARKAFTYHIPDELAGLLSPGSLVRVEFGVAMQPAIVLALRAESDIPETKPVIELLDRQPALSPPRLDLAQWLSETCLAPIGACVWLMLPPGFAGKSDRLYRFLRDDLDADQPQQLILPGANPKADISLARRLLDTLREKDDKRLRQLKRAFPKQPVERNLEQLEAAGMIESESVLAPPRTRAKTVKRLYPNYAEADIPAIAAGLGKSVKHADLLALIVERDDDALGVLDALMAVGARNRSPLNKLIAEGLVFIEETERGEQDLIILEAAPERVERMLATWRGTAFIGAAAARPARPARTANHFRSAASDRRLPFENQQPGESRRFGLPRRTGLSRFIARLRLRARPRAKADARPAARLGGDTGGNAVGRSSAILAAWRHRQRQNRDLPARHRRDLAPGQERHPARARDRADAADRPPRLRAISGPGRARSWQPARRRTLRRLGAGAGWRGVGDRRDAFSAFHALAESGLDRAGRGARRQL